MTTTATSRRPTAAARRGGYAVAALLNAALLVAVNGWPGWEAVPFLTEDTQLVTDLVNASIVVNLAANAVYLMHDPRRLRALGDLVTTTLGVIAVLRIWEVFPFDFGSTSFDWALVTRIVLVVAIAGSGIGIVVALVRLNSRPAQEWGSSGRDDVAAACPRRKHVTQLSGPGIGREFRRFRISEVGSRPPTSRPAPPVVPLSRL